MPLSRVFRWLLILMLLAGCAAPTPTVVPTLTQPLPTPTLPNPSLDVTRVPDARAAAEAYLRLWQTDAYEQMYAMLTRVSADAISQEDFVKFYRSIANEAALESINFEILSVLVNPRNAQAAYRVTLNSVLVGAITRETQMNLSLEEGSWKVQWDETLVLPELADGNYLAMDRRIPSRANIYDRTGKALVAQTDAVAVGIDTTLVDPEVEGDLAALMFRVFQRPDTHPSVLVDKIATYRQYGWYLPIGEISAETYKRFGGALSSYDGVLLRNFKARFYFDSGAAAHVVGYVSAIQANESDAYLRQGYALDERVGRTGLEGWGEQYLSGVRGGALYVFDAQNLYVTKLAETQPQAGQAIYTTLDKDLQIGAQRALNGYRGAIVVMERDTGRILAMASSPGFDPNAFEPQNYNYSFLLDELFSDGNSPLLNRATQGQYPLGSVFKVITMAAGLQTGRFTAESTYDCQHYFTELQGLTLKDWTVDKEYPPSGLLTLPQGLIRSCNPYFWHIGLDLFNQGYGSAVTDMSLAFGLGKPTGLVGLPEEKGQILLPTTAVDAVNQAIGQGSVQVTPLQVVTFMAALGNGGTLYRPQLIEQLVAPGAEPTMVFTPSISGQLALAPEHLALLQQAMIGVVSSIKPRGTAYGVLGSYSKNYISVAGKTGTAEDPPRKSHAWFAGYTYEGRSDKPDIAIVVIAENAGEGSEIAAPIFRGLVQIYFQGSRTPFPWEINVGVLKPPAVEGGEAEGGTQP